jgi:hypothetical protein
MADFSLLFQLVILYGRKITEKACRATRYVLHLTAPFSPTFSEIFLPQAHGK